MSTRLYVQNLPVYVDDEKLRKHFSTHGEVTDACVVKTKEGKSRRFGFVGFKTETQTIAAQKYFDKTFLDTTRINVKVAQPRESDDLTRPWSKYSKGSSRYKEKKDGNEDSKEEFTVEHVDSKNQNDKKETDGFEEFVETMQPRSQTKFWANDDVLDGSAKAVATIDEGNESDDEYQDLDKIHDQKEVENDSDDDNEDEMDKSVKKPMSDLDFLKSKMVRKITDSDDEDDEGDEDGEEESGDETNKKENSDVEDEAKPSKDDKYNAPKHDNFDAAPTSRLFIRNLPYSCIEEDLTELFAGYGTISELHMPLDDNKRTKGFGFVMFQSIADAENARAALDGKAFQGRLLHVLPAKAKIEPEIAIDQSTLTYKQKKELERKALASTKVGWNASYIRGDATVDALASRLQVKKGDILDKESGNMAVRLAIGETILLQENQSFFEQEGVDLKVIEGATKSKTSVERSSTVLLVKNLPFTTDEVALAQLFRTYGELSRFILPPSKTMALIEFMEASEARKAFRSLAYKKFQQVPLYLEWAPLKVFTKAATMTYNEKLKTEAIGKPTTAALPEVEAENVAELDNTLCVKNLNFTTTEKVLQNAFEKLGTIRKVTVARKKDPKTGKPTLSMGFGFVEFSTAASAKKAMQSLQGSLLEGHAIDIKLSKKQLRPVKAQKSTSDTPKTKVICRNIAFEASIKDVRELFGAFGQLKTVRMPKKFDGKHRGFAFIEFLTEAEAKSAFAALSSSHLYGRHLVLEWAEDADDIDTLRAKASRDLASIQDGQRAAKRRKNNEDVEDDYEF